MAAARVLTTGELIENILLRVDMHTVLVSAQRVCRKWHLTIANSRGIQKTLFFEPEPELLRHRVDPRGPYMRVNPLLYRHFAFLFNNKVGRHDMGWGTMLARAIEINIAHVHDADETPSIASRDMDVHRAFADPSASWRRMLVTQPPPRKVGYVLNHARRDDLRNRHTRCFVSQMPDGLRMGLLWDSVFSLLMEPREGRVTTSLCVGWRYAVFEGGAAQNLVHQLGFSDVVDFHIVELSRDYWAQGALSVVPPDPWLYRSKAYQKGLSATLRDMIEGEPLVLEEDPEELNFIFGF